MKKCIVISDSFKGTLSSQEICAIARDTFQEILPQCQLIAVPVADGGEGTVACFAEVMEAEMVSQVVHGPYGEPVTAAYARKGEKAIIEMAAAAGLPLAGESKNPELTSTYGVGELILHAVSQGCTHILLGLGGSATNDGGCGCAAALGVRFYDAAGVSFVPTGKSLSRIAAIDVKNARKRLENITLEAMCDVDNPLYGERGAAKVFAPQKGADEAMVARLDAGLCHLAAIMERDLGCRNVGQMPGGGAAGGMGAGCVAFLGCGLKSGIQGILDMLDFDQMLEGAELVITGEGRIDAQSAGGKVISGVARRTKAKGIPLVAIVGSIGEDAAVCYDLGVTAMFSIDRSGEDFRAYAGRTGSFYRRTLGDVLRLCQALEVSQINMREHLL